MVEEVLDPAFVCYDPNSEAGEVRGADNIKQEIERFRNAVPDLTYKVEHQIAEGNKVVSRWKTRASGASDRASSAGGTATSATQTTST